MHVTLLGEMGVRIGRLNCQMDGKALRRGSQ